MGLMGIMFILAICEFDFIRIHGNLVQHPRNNMWVHGGSTSSNSIIPAEANTKFCLKLSNVLPAVYGILLDRQKDRHKDGYLH